MPATPPWELTQPPDVAVFTTEFELFQELTRRRGDIWYARQNPGEGSYDYFWVEPDSDYRCVASFGESDAAAKSAVKRLLSYHPACFVEFGLGYHSATAERGDVAVASEINVDEHSTYTPGAQLLGAIEHLAFIHPAQFAFWRAASGSRIRFRKVADPMHWQEPLWNAGCLVLLLNGVVAASSPAAAVTVSRAMVTTSTVGLLELLMAVNLLPRTEQTQDTRPAIVPNPSTATATAASIRVARLALRNIRCFSDISVDFGHSGALTDWTLVLGNNAAGKSTLLRALALGLTPAQELGSMLHADGDGWTGPDGPNGEIELTLRVDGKDLTRTLKLTSERRSTRFQIEGEADRYLSECPLLLAGYGAARQLQGTKELTVYSRIDSTSTLMSPNGSLQNPELAVRRVVANKDPKSVLEQLDHILLLAPGSTQLSSSGLIVRGPDGTRRPLVQLSDGFRGTLSWVMDFIGWQFMASDAYGMPEVPAIVIVDELEQHLHPQWQRVVIARLREQFPAVQFIVSTHAPLCVIGSTDLDDADVSIVYLERGGDDEGTWSRARSGMLPPRDKRADQVLTSYMFGLNSTRDSKIVSEIHELSQLLSRETRSEQQQARVSELQRELEPLLGSAETPLEQEIHRAALAAAEGIIAREFARLEPDERERVLNGDTQEEPEL